ncbi:MAG: hypothetical protein WCH60_16865 [Burkholderiales bacterium]
MELFKNACGYEPIQVNCEGYWETPLADLPPELKKLVTDTYFLFRWDDLDPTNRRNIAAQNDYQHDPQHEPSTYFALVQFDEDLKTWIAKARQESKDSVVVALRDVADRIEQVLSTDRERVGSEIQLLRMAASQAATPTSSPPSAERVLTTTENNTLLKLVIGMAMKGYAYDPAASKSAVPKEIADDLATLGINITDDTVRKWLKEGANNVLPSSPRQP